MKKIILKKRQLSFFIIFIFALLFNISSVSANSNDEILQLKGNIKKYVDTINNIEDFGNKKALEKLKGFVKDLDVDNAYSKYKRDNPEFNSSEEKFYKQLEKKLKYDIQGFMFYGVELTRGVNASDYKDTFTEEDKEISKLVANFEKGKKPYKNCGEILKLLDKLIIDEPTIIEKFENDNNLFFDAKFISEKAKYYHEQSIKLGDLIKKANQSTEEISPLDYDNLQDGSYMVPIYVYKEVNDEDPAEFKVDYSMMNDAVYRMAKLTVEGGKKYLEYEMHPIIMPLGGKFKTGYLMDLYYIPNEDNIEKATVLSEYDLSDKYTKLYGAKYPKRLKFPYGTTGGDEYWENTKGEIYNHKFDNIKPSDIGVFVPVMQSAWGDTDEERVKDFKIESPYDREGTGTQFAKMAIFPNSIEKYEEGDINDLNSEIKKAEDIKIGEKSKKAFDTLQDTIKEIKEDKDRLIFTKDDERACREELNKAIQTFNSSQDKKVELNKTDLDAKIKDADKISQGKKSEDAFKTLKAAIEAAKNVLNSANTQEQISEALTNLNKAIDAFNNSADVPVTPGASEKVYTIPVKLMHFVQNKESMGNKALISPAKVSIKGNDVYIDLTFQGIKFMGLYGHLTNLFSFKDNTTKGEAIEAEVLERVEDNAMDGTQKKFPKVFRIKLTKDAFDNLKDNTLYVKVWVDAMDSLAGGAQGAGEQNARLVFDKSKMTEDKPGGEVPTPTPTPTPTPNVPNREAVIDALRRYANLGGSQYTYQSNMRYVNAYNSLMGLLSKSIVTESEVKSAIDELKSAATSLTLDTSKPNNSGNNNQGWGNNSGWGNNNSYWGNNSGWGNNNSNWGNNNNNNQGWGNNNNQNNQNNGPVTIQYEVPVEVLHAYENRYSMANGAINHTARVEERNGQFRYSVQFGPMQREFAGKTLTGNLYNLFIYDGSKYQAQQSSGNVWSWLMNGKYDKVRIAVWVDAMDQIAGKGQGGGEQDAILSFNWNRAREVGRIGGNNNQQNQQNQQAQQQTQQVVQNKTASNSFTDTSGHWAKTAIDYVVSKGYFNGTSNTKFDPNKSITRGQFVTVLGRILNVNTNEYRTQNFKDVKSGSYYSAYISWANRMGLVSGLGQGKFGPDKELTREEMAVIMSKFLKISNRNLNPKGNTNGFKDQGNIEPWAKDAVREMARLGVVSGMNDGSFAPKSPFTRAQVAQVLYNIDKN